MEKNKPQSAIEKKESELYSTSFKEEELIQDLPKHDIQTRDNWQNVNTSTKFSRTRNMLKKIPSKRVFKISVVFFVIALVIAWVNIYKGFDIFSPQNVSISIDGPTSIAGGEVLSFNVSITNNNDTAIESADLFVEYPSGSYLSFESEEPLQRTKTSIGKIAANQTLNETIDVVLFGAHGVRKELAVSLEFRFVGSSATLSKKDSYPVEIASSPVDVILKVKKDIIVGQEFELSVDVASNFDKTINNLLLVADYPYGFTFTKATPSPQYEDTTWNLGDLPPGGKKNITILGTMEGKDNDEVTFRTILGSSSQKDEKIIGTVYNDVTENTFLKAPFLLPELILDGKSEPSHVTKSEKTIRGDVVWTNNLPTKITDAVVEVELSGSVLDRFSISTSDGGFYRSVDNTIIWNSNSTPDLMSLEPGEQGKVSFSFSALPLYGGAGTTYSNPKITLKVNVKGRRASEDSTFENVVTSITKEVKIDSDMRIVPRIVYYEGPFNNSGNLPPRAEKETTYTIIWTITNSSSDMRNTIAKATLPTYARWMGAISPSNENVAYNDVGGEITWNVGSVDKGAGINKPARQVSFQIAFLPSISQIGNAPELISGVTLTSEDSFTGSSFLVKTRELTTRVTTDPRVPLSAGIVVP